MMSLDSLASHMRCLEYVAADQILSFNEAEFAHTYVPRPIPRRRRGQSVLTC